MRDQPIDKVRWVHVDDLSANSYNPNHVFSPELALLKQSILEDGFTQPIVVTEVLDIIDGYHRWWLCSNDKEIAAIHGGMVPCVIVRGKSLEDRMISTVRHNRARGSHGILKMGDIVRDLQASGMTESDIERRVGMEKEEQQRLSDFRGSPEIQGQDCFAQGWQPTRVGLQAYSRTTLKKKPKK